MNVVVTCDFFDLQEKKPRHIGEVLTLSEKRYEKLLSEGLIELVSDTKTSNKSRNNKGNKQKDDVQTNDSNDDNQTDDLKDDD